MSKKRIKEELSLEKIRYHVIKIDGRIRRFG